ncbi:MAG: hypothetical protein HXY24_13690, partial [Rubrivivax sp.]|nr:hypothetical protein [Rubrivivax sp.]
MKKKAYRLPMILGVILLTLNNVVSVGALTTTVTNRSDSISLAGSNGYFPQALIYQELLGVPDTLIADRFNPIIMARRQLDSALPRYKSAGWNGLALQYFDAPWLNGPSGLNNQSAICTSSQRNAYVWGNSITMTGAEFCNLHDAIVTKSSLPEFPQLFPTENWFVHNANGRISRNVGITQYRVNLGNPDVQKWFVLVARRELGKSGKATAGGVFWDDVRDNPPTSLEYPSRSLWESAIIEFLKAMQQGLDVPSWANLNYCDEFFLPVMQYLDGAMIEVWGLDWSGNPYTVAEQKKQLDRIDQGNKPVVLMVQGKADQRYQLYTLGLAYLVDDWSYFYYSGGNAYYSLPEYEYQLGAPLGERWEISSGIWQREFQNGRVTVNTNNRSATIVNGQTQLPPSLTPTLVITSGPASNTPLPASPTPTPGIASPTPSATAVTVQSTVTALPASPTATVVVIPPTPTNTEPVVLPTATQTPLLTFPTPTHTSLPPTATTTATNFVPPNSPTPVPTKATNGSGLETIFDDKDIAFAYTGNWED